MGLNFYLIVKGKEYHLGKSSTGWMFTWDLICIMRAVFCNLIELRISKGLKNQIRELLDLLSIGSNILTVDDQNNLCLQKTYSYIDREHMEGLIKNHPWFLKFEERLVVHNVNGRY